MNIVFAKHGMIGPAYCFEVPDQMVKHIKVGTELYVDTMQGASMATATTGVVTGDGAEDVARQNGAYFPLKQVLAFFAYSSPRSFYKCPRCGERVKKDSNYCQRCGQHLVFDKTAEPRDVYNRKVL